MLALHVTVCTNGEEKLFPHNVQNRHDLLQKLRQRRKTNASQAADACTLCYTS